MELITIFKIKKSKLKILRTGRITTNNTMIITNIDAIWNEKQDRNLEG